jgi:hypothetical protein
MQTFGRRFDQPVDALRVGDREDRAVARERAGQSLVARAGKLQAGAPGADLPEAMSVARARHQPSAIGAEADEGSTRNRQDLDGSVLDPAVRPRSPDWERLPESRLHPG